MKKLCIYHANCTDGFGAAWVVHHKFGDDVDFHAANYGDDAPDCRGRDVIIVDFSYALEDMKQIHNQCNHLVLLDHHKTALDNLGAWVDEFKLTQSSTLKLDMNRSGALMAWDFFFPEKKAPRIIQHISDRDLWNFKYDGTRQIHAALNSYDFDFELWDDFMDNNAYDTLRLEGEALVRKFNRDVKALVKSCQIALCIDGHTVPAANLPFLYASEAGHIMGKGNPFAACFTLRHDTVAFSLRSPEDGMDVATIAAKYGGGGHKHAAGFSVDFETFQKFRVNGD